MMGIPKSKFPFSREPYELDWWDTLVTLPRYSAFCNKDLSLVKLSKLKLIFFLVKIPELAVNELICIGQKVCSIGKSKQNEYSKFRATIRFVVLRPLQVTRKFIRVFTAPIDSWREYDKSDAYAKQMWLTTSFNKSIEDSFKYIDQCKRGGVTNNVEDENNQCGYGGSDELNEATQKEIQEEIQEDIQRATENMSDLLLVPMKRSIFRIGWDATFHPQRYKLESGQICNIIKFAGESNDEKIARYYIDHYGKQLSVAESEAFDVAGLVCLYTQRGLIRRFVSHKTLKVTPEQAVKILQVTDNPKVARHVLRRSNRTSGFTKEQFDELVKIYRERSVISDVVDYSFTSLGAKLFTRFMQPEVERAIEKEYAQPAPKPNALQNFVARAKTFVARIRAKTKVAKSQPVGVSTVVRPTNAVDDVSGKSIGSGASFLERVSAKETETAPSEVFDADNVADLDSLDEEIKDSYQQVMVNLGVDGDTTSERDSDISDASPVRGVVNDLEYGQNGKSPAVVPFDLTGELSENPEVMPTDPSYVPSAVPVADGPQF